MKARPGITIPELAESMGIKQNYLYRVMPGLAEEGKVTKSGVAGTPRKPPDRSESSDQIELATASRSSRSSFTVASIFSFAKSFTSRPCTISHSPFAQRTGSWR